MKLAIAIPTYNRPDILEENIRRILPELQYHSVAVYISDDSNNNDTATVVSKLREEYQHIYYQHNKPSYGHDRNFFVTTLMTVSDFVWYMGDSVYIQPGMLGKILPLLDLETDFVFVNSYAKDLDSRFVRGDGNVQQFLVEKTWYLTLSGATIYGPRLRKFILEQQENSSWKNFPQLGVILKFCSAHNNVQLRWFGDSAIAINAKKRSYWESKVFDVFVHDWSMLISSFLGYFSDVEIKKIIKSHALNTHIFSLQHLLFLRGRGALNPDLLRKHALFFDIASPISTSYARYMSYVPVSFAKLVYWVGAGTKGALRRIIRFIRK